MARIIVSCCFRFLSIEKYGNTARTEILIISNIITQGTPKQKVGQIKGILHDEIMPLG